MASTFFKWSGKAKWASVHSPQLKYQSHSDYEYKMCLYLDKDSLKSFKASGSRLKLRTDDEGDYVQMKAPEDKPPIVIDKDEKPMKDLVGNGSEVVVKAVVYDTKYGPGTRLIAVKVEELVEYNPTGDGSEDGSNPDVKFAF